MGSPRFSSSTHFFSINLGVQYTPRFDNRKGFYSYFYANLTKQPRNVTKTLQALYG